MINPREEQKPKDVDHIDHINRSCYTLYSLFIFIDISKDVDLYQVGRLRLLRLAGRLLHDQDLHN